MADFIHGMGPIKDVVNMPVSAASSEADRKLVSVTWPLLLIMSLMLALSLASISVLSSQRAYVNGEGHWSKAERQAIAELRNYALSGRETDYQRFRAELAVPLGDRAARLQLQRPAPDFDAAARGLMAGRNYPDDVPGMIRLFRLFRGNSLMADAIRLWTHGDDLILQLAHTGVALHEQIQSRRPDPDRIEMLLDAAEEIHRRVVPAEDGFSSALGVASRQVTRLLFLLLAGCAAILIAIGVGIARRNLRRSEKLEQALRAQERAFAAKLEHQATHDTLTGLANRPAFEAGLSAAIADQRGNVTENSLLYLDLDQFKVINDTCGHAAGDELIRQVAWTIRDQLREGDLLARLGGDEFGALLPRCTAAEAVLVAETIRRQIAELRFPWQGKLFVVNASIGVLALGESLPTVSDALSAADQACYLAKDTGRNRVQLYRPDDQQVQNRHGEMRWVERINAALDQGKFELVAQEIMPIGLRALQGSEERRFELLLRMLDAEGQSIPPMAFIPAAERYGLMPRIDRWVIAHACRELAALRSAGIRFSVCTLNLSGASVSDTSLADYISECLRLNSLPARNVGFELTETAAIGNLASASQLLARLRALGCPLALDDFGSGMSSFSYLKALPIDFLKIDGAFVRDISADAVDFAVVAAIQRIASVMGIKTVAECVDNEVSLAALAQIGVDFAQGFHISRPVPLAQIAQRGPAFPGVAEPPATPYAVASIGYR